uniref:Nudix hydrolase domain-containing protein n=1 Tax=Soboliphyme baturini TaxID=241478 RepID=A0A183IG74_9BILA
LLRPWQPKRLRRNQVLVADISQLASLARSLVTLILLVTSSRDPNTWVVPGGGIEKNESSMTAACREAFEEAGVRGLIVTFLGEFTVSSVISTSGLTCFDSGEAVAVHRDILEHLCLAGHVETREPTNST